MKFFHQFLLLLIITILSVGKNHLSISRQWKDTWTQSNCLGYTVLVPTWGNCDVGNNNSPLGPRLHFEGRHFNSVCGFSIKLKVTPHNDTETKLCVLPEFSPHLFGPADNLKHILPLCLLPALLQVLLPLLPVLLQLLRWQSLLLLCIKLPFLHLLLSWTWSQTKKKKNTSHNLYTQLLSCMDFTWQKNQLDNSTNNDPCNSLLSTWVMRSILF